MSDHTVIAILVGALAALAGVVGYSLGEQRHHRDETAVYIRQLEEHERTLRAHGALIDVIAEDYDPPPEKKTKPRRKLPEGWSVYEGGAVLVLLALLGRWLRRHWRQTATTIAAAGAGAITAAAVLGHSTPPQHHQSAPQPTPHATASASPMPSTRPSPSRTHRGTPPPVLVPLRGRRSPATSTAPSTPTGPPGPSPQATPSPGSTRRPKPPPSPSPSCLLRVSLGRIIVVCL